MKEHSSKIFAAYILLLWFWLASSCIREWQSTDYQYGWLVLPLALYFAWQRPVAGGTPAGLSSRMALAGVFVPVIAALPLELLRLSPLYWRIVPWSIFLAAAIASLSVAYLSRGRQGLSVALFPIFFASFAIPWPTFIEQAISLRLMAGVAETVAGILQFSGIPAQREGMLITLPNCVVGIQEACSGLRSLQASIMVALAAGELLRLRLSRRCLLAVVSPYVALFSNLARTLALSLIGYNGGPAAITKWHDASGSFAMLLMTALIFGAAYVMRGVKSEKPAASENRSRQSHGTVSVFAALLALMICLASARGWYLLHESAIGSKVPSLAVRNATSLPIPPDIASVLRADYGLYFVEDLPPWGRLTGYLFSWTSSRSTVNQLYHRPDVCMPGAGWTPDGEPIEFEADLNGKPTRWHLLTYKRQGIRANLIWGAWLNGAPVDFALGRSTSIQAQVIWQLVRQGVRDATYEMAAVLVPIGTQGLSPAEATEILQATFSENENPSLR